MFTVWSGMFPDVLACSILPASEGWFSRGGKPQDRLSSSKQMAIKTFTLKLEDLFKVLKHKLTVFLTDPHI